jgi:hypothetical protein
LAVLVRLVQVVRVSVVMELIHQFREQASQPSHQQAVAGVQAVTIQRQQIQVVQAVVVVGLVLERKFLEQAQPTKVEMAVRLLNQLGLQAVAVAALMPLVQMALINKVVMVVQV